MTELTDLALPEPDGLSRRETLRGMAWAAPAIVIATSVPASATSGGGAEVPIVSGTWDGAKWNKGETLNKECSVTIARGADDYAGNYVVSKITIGFTSFQTQHGSDALVALVSDGWVVDYGSSDLPEGSEQAGTLVIVPETPANGTIGESDSLTVTWSLSRYLSIDFGTVDGGIDGGTGSVTPITQFELWGS